MFIMKAKHLSLDDRKAIQSGIENRLSKTVVAPSIFKDPTTVANKIKKHRILKPRNRFNSPVVCSNFKLCSKPHRFCSEHCSDSLEQTCSLRDRSVGACNHCDRISHLPRKIFNYRSSSDFF